MLEDILELFKGKHFKDVVLTRDMKFVLDTITKERKEGLKFNVIDDARSASFFALGRIKVTEMPVLLLTTSEELGSTLTGITEANYQYLPLIIVTIGETPLEMNAECFKYVTKKILNATDNDGYSVQKINDYINGKWYKPLLIQIPFEKASSSDSHQTIYCEMINCLINNCNSDSQMFIGTEFIKEPFITIQSKNIKIKTFESSYGAASKFFGHAALVVTISICSLHITAFAEILMHLICGILKKMSWFYM